MGRQYARGERAWGICGRSGRKMLLKDMVFDGRYPNMRVDPDWYEARHPLETLPMVDDPVALYRPSPEVVDPPSAPILTLAVISRTQVNVTFTPAESNITEIASYIISRAVNGGTYTQIATCVLERDFLGGITGITNATFPVYPELPGDPHATVPPDQPMTYIDTAVSLGSTYCYQVEAVPMGNNQANAQGPPVVSAPVCVTLEEVDFFLTSQLYPLTLFEQFGEAALAQGGSLNVGLYHIPPESAAESATLLGGSLAPGMIPYSNWPPENVGESAALVSGTLVVTGPGVIAYNNWPAEKFSESATLTGGSLTLGLIQYTHALAEGVGESASLTGGSLS